MRLAGEAECPAEDLDLLDWIEAGLEFGRRSINEQPQLVSDIFQECAGKRLEASRSVIQETVAKAGRIEPAKLIRPILEWYANVFQSDAPHFYGQRLARVGCLTDFAVWISWLHENEV